MHFRTTMALLLCAALCGTTIQAATPTRAETIDAIAATLYAEARGEGFIGLQMVASVIWNRANGNADKLYGVITKPKQFSCWNDGKPSVVRHNEKEELIWKECLAFGKALVNGTFKPITEATHYCVLSRNPSWTRELKWLKNVGNHKFYC